MLPDFIYCPFSTPAGVHLELISAEPCRDNKLWLNLAYQIYCENGRNEAREIGHFASGAPFLYGSESRISITHTSGLLAVASLPRTPEADLRVFAPRTAMGVDAEPLSRQQAAACRERFLNADELALIPADDIEAHVLAWTIKEALYKAALTPGLDFRKNLLISKMPKPQALDADFNPGPFNNSMLGAATILLPEGSQPMELYALRLPEHLLTIAICPKCAKFHRPRQ